MSAANPLRPAEPDPAFRLVETSFDEMPAFAADDHLAAWHVFRRSAQAIADRWPPLRPAAAPDEALTRLCRMTVAEPELRSPADAWHFFETRFRPHRIILKDPADARGFLTGYYEPEVEGSLTRSHRFTAPVLARPADLGRIGPGVSDNPYLDRASIEARIGTAGLTPVVWLRDWVEVFFIHVQGSARVRLPDGRVHRLVYDGRNGQPYTSIGHRLVETGTIPLHEMSLDRLKAWLRHEGQAIGEPGRDLMQANRSYIFFRMEPEVPGEGPIGGAGVPLTSLRSLAVDRGLWSYGLPFFVEAELPWQDARPRAFARLMVAQDTGSAILGPARADLFFGAGQEAGRRAGDIRHAADFTVLLPRATPEAS